MIGGQGADLLDGSADDDLVIGGWTDYDTNPAALDALLAAWAQPLPYNQRIENLQDNGVAYPGGRAFLTKNHVHDDQAADTLIGGLGRDWFFRDPLLDGLDSILDLVESGPDKERVTMTRKRK
jgi:Ca2+-binding RTX toxin-like protein